MKKTLLLLTISLLAISTATAYTGPSIDELILKNGGTCYGSGHSIPTQDIDGFYSFDFIFDADYNLQSVFDSECQSDYSTPGFDTAFDVSTATYCDVNIHIHGTVQSTILNQVDGWTHFQLHCTGYYAGQYHYKYSEDGTASFIDAPTLDYFGTNYNPYLSLLHAVESKKGRIA